MQPSNQATQSGPYGSPDGHPVSSSIAQFFLTLPDAGEAAPSIWRSERGAPPPKRVVIADDTTPADTAYRLACEGTGLLWRGDFQNARHMLQALARRTDKPAKRNSKPSAPHSPSETFHLFRQAQAQRARVLSMVLLSFDADYGITLRRAPDARLACAEAWGPADLSNGPSVASLRELLGLISAHEWRKKGVEIASLGTPPNNRIHPHYGVFSPVRGEYVGLVAAAPLPAPIPLGASFKAFDIGTGTGVLSAVLARRGVGDILATDQDPRALTCARENLVRLGVANQIQLLKTDLFPEGLAHLIVCNPPWLPARASSPIEHAVYDEDSRMLLGFLNGLAGHLAAGGEGWLIMSNLAEHLGLRTPDMLAQTIDSAGLQVLGRLDAKPMHPKASDATDPLHAARSLEVTTLWRLAAKATA